MINLHNLHEGETCLIIGNGPSLKQIPVDFLTSYMTFGSNRIYLLDGFAPDYYACINPLVCRQSMDEINAMQCKEKFIRQGFSYRVEDAYILRSSNVPMFSKKPLDHVYEGFTVTYVLLQLAYYMGFTRVGLVGVDHRYSFIGAPNQLAVSEGDDPNHFHPEYFGKGVRWHNPDLERSEHAYRLARTAFEQDGREIANLTPGSALNTFERKDWKSW